MSADPFKDAPRLIGAVHSPMLADPTWIIGFRWMAGELLKAGRAATRHGSMPSYSTMLIETKWKPFLKGFAAHLWKVVQDGRNSPGFLACILNGDIVEAYELACAILDESITVDGQKITLPSHPSENMLAALEDIVQMLSRWQAPPNEPEAASPPPPREKDQPPAALNLNLPGRSAVSARAAEDDAMALARMGLNLSNPPAAVDASEDKTSEAPAIDYDAVANKLAAQRKSTQAALVQFMKDKGAAPFDDVAYIVHGDSNASEKAVAKNAERTSDSLAVLGCPVSFRLAGGLMHKEISPE
jgi:hypothetical protein